MPDRGTPGRFAGSGAGHAVTGSAAAVEIEIAGLPRAERYSLMNQVVLPRPIAWVVSDYGADRPAAERWNLAPYSYFNAVSSDPPTVVLGINNRDHPAGLKDTVRNLRRQPDFTISLPSADAVDAVAQTSDDLPWGHSEAARGDITLTDWAGWSAPRVDRCRIAFACRLLREIHLDDPTQSLLVARIHRVWISPSVVAPDPGGLRIDVAALQPIARAGNGQFLQMSDIRYGRRPGAAATGPADGTPDPPRSKGPSR
jgi:flavin reductase (DIM6/NTAB) family NADH-FMN oxidoreductase RutF